MFSAGRQQCKRRVSKPKNEAGGQYDFVLIPLAIPLLAGPSAIMSVIVATTSFAGDGTTGLLTGYAALLAVMVIKGLILTMTVVAEGWLDEPVPMVFSRMTAIILAGLSVQYVIDGLATIGFVTP